MAVLGCAASVSAPSPQAGGPGRAQSAPTAAAADDAESESTLRTERFPAAAPPTWPDDIYGSDALLEPTPPYCSLIQARAPTRCAAGAEPLASLAEAIGKPRTAAPSRAPGSRYQLRGKPWADPARLKPLLERDHDLWTLEACNEFPAGFIRQLRAELFVDCASTIAQLDSDPTSKLPDEARATLQALAFAARLRRFEAHARRPIADEVTKEDADEYVPERLAPWLKEHLHWLRLQEAVPPEFARGSYARALALWALARAWVVLRAAPATNPYPVSQEMKQDYELRVRFYGAIDEATSELRRQGTDVFPRALEALAWQGTTRSAWSKDWLWMAVAAAAPGARRWSPLFYLALPRLELAERPTTLQRLLERLPPYYAEKLVSIHAASDRATLASMLTRGIAPNLRRTLTTTTHPDQLWALAQLRVRLGILSHDRRQFEWAHEHLQRLMEVAKQGEEPLRSAALHYQADARWLGALMDALRRGPPRASEWPGHSVPIFDTTALEFVARNGATVMHRGLAQAAVAELARAGAAPVSELTRSLDELRKAYEHLKNSPYENCVLSSLDEKRGSWIPLNVGPDAECQVYKRNKKIRARKAGPLLPDPPQPGRRYFGTCGPLAWQNQRHVETPVTRDQWCH